MPFADDGGVVTGLLQQFGQGRLGAVEGVPVIPHPIEVAVFSGEQYCPAGRADGVGDKAVFKQSPLFRQPVDMRRCNQLAAIAADRLLGMVVRHDEEDVGLLR